MYPYANMKLSFVSFCLLLHAGHSFSLLPPSSRRQTTSFSFTNINDDDVIAPDEASFDSLGLSPQAVQAIKSQADWIVPTPIQQMAIPQLLQSGTSSSEGDDPLSTEQTTRHSHSVWCRAPTGSGKTGAYVVPLLDRLRNDHQNQPQDQGMIRSLILCPTRELVVQVGRVVSNLSNNFSSNKRWNVMTVYGGVPLEPQISALVDNTAVVDVLVATPGRLYDVLTHYDDTTHPSTKTPGRRRPASAKAQESAMEQRLLQAMDATGKNTLSLSKIEELQLDRDDDEGRAGLVNLLQGVEYVVLDEADRLLGKAFESEVDSVLELLPHGSSKKGSVHTWMFSATFPKAMEPRMDQVVQKLGAENVEPPVRISCTESDRVMDQETVSSSLKKRLARTSTFQQDQEQQKVGPASTIHLRTIRLEKPDRTQVLRQLLKQDRSGHADNDWDRVLVFVATRYATEHVARKLRRVGISAAELHGKLDQDARIRRLSDFSKGKIRCLIATDVASRGLDVQGLPLVVNYDLPRSPADFVHRIGRTGRAGREGTAITFVTAPTEAQLDLIEKRHLPEPVEREVLPGLQVDEDKWKIESQAARISAPGTTHSTQGLAHDRMHGGIKGRRKSKKDRLREKAAREALN